MRRIEPDVSGLGLAGTAVVPLLLRTNKTETIPLMVGRNLCPWSTKAAKLPRTAEYSE
jgi:hypothetical protein